MRFRANAIVVTDKRVRLHASVTSQQCCIVSTAVRRSVKVFVLMFTLLDTVAVYQLLHIAHSVAENKITKNQQLSILLYKGQNKLQALCIVQCTSLCTFSLFHYVTERFYTSQKTPEFWHSLFPPLSVLTAIFQVNLGQPVFIEAKDDGGGGDNWTTGAISRAKLQSDHHHQQTNIQFFTGRMSFLSPNQQCQSKSCFLSELIKL